MADFLTNLWSSIFTPGPTDTLLIATNVSFGLLQILLFALLVATYSIHFLILSVLCGGLWYAINWFAVELRQAQKEEGEAKAAAVAAEEKVESRRAGVREGDADDEGEDTEVEEGGGRGVTSAAAVGGKSAGSGSAKQQEKVLLAGDLGSRASGAGATTGVEGIGGLDRDARRRRVEDMDRSGEISTDSEWEKVSNDGR